MGPGHQMGSAECRSRIRAGRMGGNKVVHTYDEVTDIPDAIDWREAGVISPVKDQHSYPNGSYSLVLEHPWVTRRKCTWQGLPDVNALGRGFLT
jgi:hypothetical protein